MYAQTPEQQIESVEISLTHARATVEVSKAVERLLKNRDFKKVVLEQYFEQEAIRLVLLKSDPNWQKPEAKAEIEAQMCGIGEFRKYLNAKIQLGHMAARAIEDDEETLADLRTEV